MDNNERQEYDSAIESLGKHISTLDKENGKLKRELKNYKTYASIAASKGRATRKQNKVSCIHNKSRYFVKVMRTANQKVRRSKLFSPAEKQLIWEIEPFIDYEGMVVDEHKKMMTITCIRNLCGWGKTHIINTINSLEKKGFLSKIKQGTTTHIKVSQEYYMCGTSATVNLKEDQRPYIA